MDGWSSGIHRTYRIISHFQHFTDTIEDIGIKMA
jgi:hypothetical protein